MIKKYLIKEVYKKIKDLIEKPYDFKEYNKILFSGMGASGIVGNLMEDYLNNLELFKNKIIKVHKGYNLPNYVDKDWLVVTISYSGKTEETLSVLEESVKKGINTVFISSNNSIENLYNKNNYFPLIVPKTELPPRYNLASLLSGALSLFFEKEEIDNIFNFNEPNYRDLDKIIEEIKEKIPVVYVSQEIKSVSERIAQQFNENSKKHCIYGYFSEANHNQLEVNEKENFVYFFLRHPYEHGRISKRFEIIKDLYKKERFKFFEIKSKENNLLKNMLHLLNIFDYITIKLGIEREVPFADNPLISQLKEKMK